MLKPALQAIPSLAAALALSFSAAGPAAAAAYQHPGPASVSAFALRAPSQQTAKIAITQVLSSHTQVTQGDEVDIHVKVQDLGAGTETFALSLWDNTDGREINSITLSLEADQGLTIGFRWDTRSASPRAHVLTATAHAPGDPDEVYDSRSLDSPITVTAARITFDELAPPRATFGDGLSLARPDLTTPATPLDAIFLGERHASHAGALVRADVGTRGTGLPGIFVSGAAATFQPGRVLQNPFSPGEVIGSLRLQSRPSSLGAYVQVGGDTYFVDPDGSYRVTTPGGVFDILLEAPGYVPVRIVGVSTGPGQVLPLPEMTLPFGDANGDGKIDILDLSIAAGNFGETLLELPAP